jgi:hypothetical protein
LITKADLNYEVRVPGLTVSGKLNCAISLHCRMSSHSISIRPL